MIFLQNELFCKIKSNLKIKAFYGTSKNAGLIQIWTALIACLLLVWLRFKSKAGWGLLELPAWPKPCFWSAWTGERCLVSGIQMTDNLYYSISVLDSSDTL